MYTDLDKEFLRSRGVETIDDPETFFCVDNSSLVYSLHTYGFIYRIISEGPWPAALACDGLNFVLRKDSGDT